MLARRHVLRTVAPVAIGALLALPGAAAGASASAVEVVAEGLDNPRGLAVHGDELYVAEAGRGGPGPCLSGPEGGATCLGATGAITRVDLDDDETTRVVPDLPSLAGQEDDPSTPGPDAGVDALGPSDVIVRGDRLLFTVGLGADPARRADLGPAGAALAKLWRYDLEDGTLTETADIGAYEATANPDEGEPDTNPNSVAATRGLRAVVDAGGNSLLGVRRGEVSTLAVFPTTALVPAPFPDAPDPFPVQPVPTSVVRGPDGDWYVGQLTGFPFPAGAAEVYRVPRNGGEPEVVASGLTTILDLAFDEDGDLYVLQATRDGLLAPPSPGVLLRIDDDGDRTEIAAGRLTFPTGLAIGGEGDTLYVSNRGNEPGTGEVVAIDADR
jgi:sugar lactone lactonase YvrE